MNTHYLQQLVRRNLITNQISKLKGRSRAAFPIKKDWLLMPLCENKPHRKFSLFIQGMFMAQDIFIKINGIEGESQDAIHKREIEVLGWDWSFRQMANMHSGSGGGAGRCTVDDLHFEHYVDKSSPNLLQYCLTGKHIPEAVLTVRNAGNSPLEYLRIMLQEVIITEVHLIYFNTMRVPRESISLAFSRIKMDYIFKNAEGNRAGTISMGYDIKYNTAI